MMNLDQEALYNAKEKATEVKKCPSCGANLAFNPEKQLLACDHCGTEVPIDEVGIAAEQAFDTMMQKAPDWTETHVYRCNNCGAKEVLNQKDISLKCSYCGTTNIVETEELSGKKPTGVVPFRISIQQAAQAVFAWVKKLFFAPKAFKLSARPEELRGVYNPAFTFDTDTTSYYNGRLGKHYYTTTTRNGKTVRVQHTRWFQVNGTYQLSFDDLLIQASQAIAQKSLEKLSPFDTNNSKDYSQDFLSGYSANRYSKDGLACWKDALPIIDKRVRKGILAKYSHDVVGYLNVDTRHQNTTYKYLLLPLYVGHCSYHGKNYNFFVNGFNGKVTGKAPVSILKVGLVVLIAIAIAAAVYFALTQYN